MLGIFGLFAAVETVILPVVAGLFNNPDLKSIHAVRKIERLKHIPFYYDCKEELRIEIVYEAGCKILPYCFEKGQKVPVFPFVLVSENEPEKVFSQQQLEYLNLEVIGLYDDNKRPANTSWHSPKFVHYVTLVTEK